MGRDELAPRPILGVGVRGEAGRPPRSGFGFIVVCAGEERAGKRFPDANNGEECEPLLGWSGLCVSAVPKEVAAFRLRPWQTNQLGAAVSHAGLPREGEVALSS